MSTQTNTNGTKTESSPSLAIVVKTGTKPEMIKAIRAASMTEIIAVFGSTRKAEDFLRRIENLA